jgi:hypothetical protein
VTDIETVRLKTSDRPRLYREQAEGNGSTTDWRLEAHPLLPTPVPRVWQNDTELTVVTHFTVDYEDGIISLLTAPALGDELVFEYMAVVFSDADVEQFLADAGGSTLLGSAFLLQAWSAEMAKVARRETINGGGPLGAVTTDTAVRAKELRESSRAYLDMYRSSDAEGGGAYDSLTRVAWTHWVAQDIVLDELFADISAVA